MNERAVVLSQKTVSLANTPVETGLLQRKCACGGTPGATGECQECRKKRLQRKAAQCSTLNPQLSEVPPIVHEVLRSAGQPLDPATRSFMESRFDYDFGNVRVHADAKAAQSARAVHANAYTVGCHLVFRAKQYVPDNTIGRKLIAHELAHVIQQTRNQEATRSSRGLPAAIGSQFSYAETEAKLASEAVMSPNVWDSMAQNISATTQGVQRDVGSEYYSKGYLDGENGHPYQPGPLDKEALDDYDEGYFRGRNEFLKQSKLAASSTTRASQLGAGEKNEGASAKKSSGEWKQTAVDLAKSKALVAAGAGVGKVVAGKGGAKLGGVYGWAVDFATSPGGDVKEKYSGYRAVEMQGHISMPVGDVHIKRENAEKDAAAYVQRTGRKATVEQVILDDPDIAID